MVEIIVAVIGCVGIITAAVVTNLTATKRLEKKVDSIAEHEKENYLNLLRLTVMSEEMPDSERIIAGSKYLSAGGNGDVKHFYLDFVKTHTINGN